MAEPQLSIALLALADRVQITPTVSDEPTGTLEKVSAIVNDNTSSRAITEINIPFLDENDNRLTVYELNSSQLPLGVPTFIQLRYVYVVNGIKTFLTSQASFFTLKSVPQAIALELDSNVRQEDQFLSIRLSPTHSPLSLSDGFSVIRQMIVYTSKVGAQGSNDFRSDVIDVASGNDYSNWFAVAVENGAGQLQNEEAYEIAVQLKNDFGLSPMSNTIVATPKNTPNTIARVLTKSLLTYQRDSGFTEDDSRGDVVIQWSKPSDFNVLINSQLGVTKYFINKQLMVKNSQDIYVPSGPKSVISLDVPYTAPGELNQDGQTRAAPVVNEPTYAHAATVDGLQYDYKYTIEGSASDLGKRFDYTVTSENDNGLSPESTVKSVVPFANPNKQSCTVLHHSVTSNITGAPITIYDGKQSMEIAALSSINGGAEHSTLSMSADKNVDGKTAVGISIQNYIMKLIVKDITNSVSPITVSNGDVTFVQQTEVVDGTQAGTKVQRSLDQWVLSFDDVQVDQNNNLNQHLALHFGNKFSYELHRISLDPNNNPIDINDRFEAAPEVIERTSFKSPQKVPEIGVYSFNDNLSPVKKDGSAAVRLVFKQLTNDQMNGLAAFTGPKVYYPHKDSFPIPGAFVNHINGHTDEIEYIVSMASEGLGVNANLYLRVKIHNNELGLDIDAEESSPVVVEVARDYPQSVTGLTVAPDAINSTKINISWTKQPDTSVVARGGFSSANLQNRVIVVKDHSSSVTPVLDHIVDHNAVTQAYSVEDLDPGAAYKVYVIAEGKYTKANLVSSSPDRFASAIVSNNIASKSLVLTGSPSAPIIEGRFSADKKFTVLYDQPAVLNGVPANNLVYYFYMNKQDTANFPYLTNPSTNLQKEVATATVTTSTNILRAFSTEADSSDVANLVDLQNDVVHYFSMLAKASVGGNALQTVTDPYTYAPQIINGSNFNREINLVSDSLIPIREVVGAETTKEIIVPGAGVPQPTIELSGAQNIVTVSVIKVGAPVTDLDITVDNNDALNQNGLQIPQFNTVLATYTSGGTTYTGLFALEQAYQNNEIQNVNDGNGNYPFGPSGWNFRRVINSSVTRYLMDFTNLTNGKLFDFHVRFGKTIGSSTVYGEPAVQQAAAEAPPATVADSFFKVDSNKITVEWTAPSNSGGAGVQGNGPLQFKVQLLLTSSSSVVETLIKSANELTAEFTGLTNWSNVNSPTYSVQILAFYNKSTGQLVEGSAASPRPYNNSLVPTQYTNGNMNEIRVNAAPVNATLALTAGDNQITGKITTAPSATQNLYKMTRYEVLLKRKDAAANVAPEEKFRLTDSTNNGFTGNVTTDINPMTGLLNGLPYIVIVSAVPTYGYAQGPDDEEYEVSPLGPLTITAANIVNGSNNRIIEITFNSNGSGPANTVIALGRSSGSSAIVVKNLNSSSNNLPNITYSGAETTLVAAGQTGKFTLSFAELSDPGLTDCLTVVGSAKSTDTFVFPTEGPQFFA